ncbi:MAG: PQQ-binding-like beta-propeller repeat protein [Planctomycetes bacterium]|nr:PQQ-binding-like beta-propeller repeat protein [Planctomycetota bacterium]
MLLVLRRSALVALALSLCGPVMADNWPGWRGPTGNGISTEVNLPTEWSPTKNVAWKLPLPGPAGSTPVVWGDHIFLTSVNDQGDLLLIAVNTSGKQLWQQVVATGNMKARGDEGNSASPSPVTDGKHVWTFMGEGTLACYTVDGQKVWKINLQDRYGKFQIQFGMSSTPVLDNGVLYLQLIHGDGNATTREACVIALDGASGKQIWKVDRPSNAHSENEHSYASAMLYQDDQTRLLLTHGADFIVAHDLKDGHEVWRCGGLNRNDDPALRYDPTLRFVASPVAVPGLIIAPSAKGHPILAIKPDGHGDITNVADKHYWTYKKTPDVPTPIVVEDLAYLCMENGNLTVLEARTGKEIYTQATHRQRHRASPVYADGKLYLTARDGKVNVIQAGREFKILAENDLGEDQSSSPAISNGTIYMRTFGHLWAIRKQ